MREVGLDPNNLHVDNMKKRPLPLNVEDDEDITIRGNAMGRNPSFYTKRSDQVEQECTKILGGSGPGAGHGRTGEVPVSNGQTEATTREPPGYEEHEDLHDALSPIYDQLKLNRLWWPLEFLPMIGKEGWLPKYVPIYLYCFYITLSANF